MIREELLTVHNIHLFSTANLTRMDFSLQAGDEDTASKRSDAASPPTGHEEPSRSKYAEELTDEWLLVLFEGVVRHYSEVQRALQQQMQERSRNKQRMDWQQPPPPPHALRPRSMSTPADPMPHLLDMH
jgi:hypothetical protein